MNLDKEYLTALAALATDCLVAQMPVTITRHVTVERNGFPLPMRRVQPDADGNVIQDYRPLAVLEWVNDTLVAAAKADRLAAVECDDLFGGM